MVLPRSMLVVPASKLVLIATLERLDNAWLAYAPPVAGAYPLHTLPVVQTVPDSSGNVMVRLAVGAVKARVVALAPLVAVMVEPLLPWRVKAWVVDPMVRAPVGVMVLVVIPALKVLLELKTLEALSNATLALKRASATVPLARLEALRLVRAEPLRAGRKPEPSSWTNLFAMLKVLPCKVTLEDSRESERVPDEMLVALRLVISEPLTAG